MLLLCMKSQSNAVCLLLGRHCLAVLVTHMLLNGFGLLVTLASIIVASCLFAVRHCSQKMLKGVFCISVSLSRMLLLHSQEFIFDWTLLKHKNKPICLVGQDTYMQLTRHKN